MEKLLIIIVFILELKKYLIGNKLVFHRANPVRWMEYNAFVAIVLYTIFSICIPQSVLVDMLVVYGVIIVITWFAVCTPDVHGKVLSVICLAVIAYCINKSFYPVTNSFEQKFQILQGVTYWRLLLESLCGMLVVVVLGGLMQRKRKKRRDILSPVSVTYLLVIVIIQMMGTIMGVKLVSGYVVRTELQWLAEALVVLVCISVCLLLWMLMYLRTQREHTEEELTLSEELRETETAFYQALLEKEEDTRRFRHDAKNHIFCINELMNQGKIEETKAYLQNLSEEFGEITKWNFHTQNDMFDAILHDKLKRLDDDVEISVQGYFVERERMELYDFCLVFSNLLNNAVEELLKVKETGKSGVLQVGIKCAEKLTEVRISNSVVKRKSFNTYGLPETGKSDKKNHGFGLKKVQQTLEKYEGDMKFKSTEEVFEVMVKY